MGVAGFLFALIFMTIGGVILSLFFGREVVSAVRKNISKRPKRAKEDSKGIS